MHFAEEQRLLYLLCFRDDDHDDDGSDEAASNDEGDYDAAELVTRATTLRCFTAATTVEKQVSHATMMMRVMPAMTNLLLLESRMLTTTCVTMVIVARKRVLGWGGLHRRRAGYWEDDVHCSEDDDHGSADGENENPSCFETGGGKNDIPNRYKSKCLDPKHHLGPGLSF